MTDEFKEDRAAFEAATPGEWDSDDGPPTAWPRVTTKGPPYPHQVAVLTAPEDAALIVRMHSTYLARMARIEELETENQRLRRRPERIYLECKCGGMGLL